MFTAIDEDGNETFAENAYRGGYYTCPSCKYRVFRTSRYNSYAYFRHSKDAPMSCPERVSGGDSGGDSEYNTYPVTYRYIDVANSSFIEDESEETWISNQTLRNQIRPYDSDKGIKEKQYINGTLKLFLWVVFWMIAIVGVSAIVALLVAVAQHNMG